MRAMAARSFLPTTHLSFHLRAALSLVVIWIAIVSCAQLVAAQSVFSETIQGGELGEQSILLPADKVTATVPDIRPPTPPFLISPANQSYITTRTPTFVWRAAVDDYIMSHYQLWIDGKLFLNSIPLVSVSHALYTLRYDPITDQYSLTLKRGLTEGRHTWKIVAVDAAGNRNSSATWSFTIDTQAPQFVIHQIGTLAVAISAYDATTIPERPIELHENEPILRGVGEPHSSITLTLITEDGSTFTYTTTIDQYGNWMIQLPILPRNQVIVLNFVIEDQAGLITVLNGVRIIILGFDLEAGSTLSPTPAQTTGPPTPTFIFGNFWPLADWKPEFTKRLAPIKEFVYGLLQQIAQLLPPSIAVKFQAIPTQLTQAQPWLYGWLNLLIALWWPTIALIALTLFTRGRFGPGELAQLLRSLHLWPLTSGFVPTQQGGWVYDAEHNQGAAFVNVHLFSLEQDRVVETVLTDKNGFFPAFSYLANQPKSETYQHYRLTLESDQQTLEFAAAHPLWPSKTFASYTYFHNTYQGGIFSFRHDNAAPYWLVPVQPYTKTIGQSTMVLLANLSDMPLGLLSWQIVLTFLVLVFYTSLPNAVVVLYLVALLGARLAQLIPRYSLSVQVINQDAQPLKNALVFCRPIYDPTLVWIEHTNANGFARFTLTKPNLLRSTYKDTQFFIRSHQTELVTVQKKQTIESQRITVGKTINALQLTLSPTATTNSSCLL
jgi:hypothetical protein